MFRSLKTFLRERKAKLENAARNGQYLLDSSMSLKTLKEFIEASIDTNTRVEIITLDGTRIIISQPENGYKVRNIF